MKRGRGRPKKSAEDKMHRLTIYVTNSDRERLKELAAYRGAPVGTIIRQTMLEELRREGM